MHKIHAHIFLNQSSIFPQKNIHTRFDPLTGYKRKQRISSGQITAADSKKPRHLTVSLFHQTLRGASLPSIVVVPFLLPP